MDEVFQAKFLSLISFDVKAPAQVNSQQMRINFIIVKFLQDKKKYRKRRAKISADISARLFRVTCNKVSGILIHKD